VFEREATELPARAFQHEIDHLHGKLFIDYLSFLKRRGVMARWETSEKYPGQRRVQPRHRSRRAGERGRERVTCASSSGARLTSPPRFARC
jgi:hypothetical protein